MGILLLRHAEAIRRTDLDDASRWLSTRGRAQVREVAGYVRERKLKLSRMLTSPLVRAVQTAELFAHGVSYDAEIAVLPTLSFTLPPEQAARTLAAYAPSEHVAAVGHMPTISRIAALLTSGAAQHEFATSEALFLEGGRVVWSVAPR